jgi:hypothetical protein
MSKFDDIIKNKYIIMEADVPSTPTPAGGASPMGAPVGGAPPMGDMGGGSPDIGSTPGGGATTPEDMDDDAKKDADPIEFTRSVLEKLVEVTPEMFNSYIDMFSKNFKDVQDKEGFKKYYKTFHDIMEYVTSNQERMKYMFVTIQKMIKNIPTSRDTTPDSGGGGTGKSGPSGPGV